MESSLNIAHARVCELIEHFATHEAHYLSAGYQEAEARKDFIDPFLIAFGWDVNHEREKNPFEQEVKVERGVAVANAQKRADYAFYLKPNYRDVRFFVEAKKPSVVIATDRDAHFQTVRYGSNAQTPLALLTDFQELHILDCRLPADIDTALDRVHRKYHYRELEDPARFAELYWLFSREALESGAHDRYVAALKKPRGAAKQSRGIQRTFDERFLDELEEHREHLAQSFKRQHHDLDGDSLTELVQRVLDRLVFLRFLEDKLIETRDCIADFGRSGSAWADFTAASRRLDGIYNGVVFKKHPRLDAPDFLPDDRAFAEVCRRLSHIHSPYLFSIIPIHVLGSIYERFLGKIIVSTEQRARVEEKPEVRKAGGVYYTPEYIVRYIVGQTVGRIIAGKSPTQIEKLRFADIACGSGSFLLGVFDCLLRYHAAWYNDLANARRAKADGCIATEEGAWRLSLQQRRAILVNNVYGVDLDAQAVEVAQLSLYLKLLEDETTASARGYQLEFHETLLPSLAKNIVAGNSLIGTDILLQSDFAFTPREERKLGAMDFDRAFPEVFRDCEDDGRMRELGYQVDVDFDPHREPVRYDKPKTRKAAKTAPEKLPDHIGGFDAIVGNPPYGALTGPRETQYLRAHYQSVANSMDTFLMFMERAASLLRRDGALGYIVPSGWVSTPSSRKLRRIFAEQFRPESFVSLPYDVFAGAYIDTITFTARKTIPAIPWKQLSDPAIRLVVFPIRYKVTEQEDFTRFEKTGDLSRWMANEDSEFLVTSSTAELALIEKIRRTPHTCETFVDVMRGIEKFDPRDRAGMRSPVAALTGDIHRYLLTPGTPAFEDYTAEIAAAKAARFFNGPRILLRQLLSRKFRLQAIYTTDPFLTNQSVQSLVARQENQLADLRSVLAVLNSRLISWYFCQINMVARRDDFPKTIIKQTRELPFPNLAGERIIHDRLVLLVDHLLAGKKQEAASPNETDREYFARKCEGLDAQIDALVCQLYGLSPSEIALVEGRT